LLRTVIHEAHVMWRKLSKMLFSETDWSTFTNLWELCHNWKPVHYYYAYNTDLSGLVTVHTVLTCVVMSYTYSIDLCGHVTVHTVLTCVVLLLYIRGRPNFVFVFGTEKDDFFIFRRFIFRPKKNFTLSVFFIFRSRKSDFRP